MTAEELAAFMVEKIADQSEEPYVRADSLSSVLVDGWIDFLSLAKDVLEQTSQKEGGK